MSFTEIPERRTFEKRAVASLRAHPKQAVYFPGGIVEHVVLFLMASISADGLKFPIEVLPDGTIVSGHHRWEAVKRLGWTEVDVVVLWDIFEQGEQAIEARLIRANCGARNFTKMQSARMAAAVYRLEPAGHARRGSGSKAEVIGRQFGVSGKELMRMLTLAALPLVIQHAIDAKDLRQYLALKLAKCGPGVAAHVVSLVDGKAGISVCAATLQVLQQATTEACRARRAGRELRRLVERVQRLDSNVEILAEHCSAASLRAAEKLKALAGRLLSAVGKQAEQSAVKTLEQPANIAAQPFTKSDCSEVPGRIPAEAPRRRVFIIRRPKTPGSAPTVVRRL